MTKHAIIPRVLSLPFYSAQDLRVRIGWYINMRWIAVFGALASAPIGEYMLKFNLAYKEIVIIASTLIVINLVYFFLWRHLSCTSEIRELTFAEIQIIADLIIISFLIHYSGGIDNPFFFLYLVQVILSGIMFPGAVLPYLNAVIAAFLLTLWTALEYTGAVGQYSLSESKLSVEYLVISLSAFYVINFSGIYIINNFMMRYRKLKTEVDKKSRELEGSIEDRNKAFRFAAHELKSPVIAIKSTLEVLNSMYGKEMKYEITEMISRAEKRTDQVLSMIKELIAITHYNLGIDKPKMERVRFNEWIDKIIVEHKYNAHEKDINLSVAHPNKEFEVEIDVVGMEKVFNNLVNNALRYTYNGGWIIVRSFADKKMFGFSVQDNGIGISEEDQERIFSEFYRGKRAKEMEQIGTGLGLNLVKEIVRINGGKIFLESKVGKGSTFTVELPFEELTPLKQTDVNKLYMFE